MAGMVASSANSEKGNLKTHKNLLFKGLPARHIRVAFVTRRAFADGDVSIVFTDCPSTF
jgi:hypothetical protein